MENNKNCCTQGVDEITEEMIELEGIATLWSFKVILIKYLDSCVIIQN